MLVAVLSGSGLLLLSVLDNDYCKSIIDEKFIVGVVELKWRYVSQVKK